MALLPRRVQEGGGSVGVGGGSVGVGGGNGDDTTLTKIFVGGLAWGTQRDTMRRYFERFGEIVEAVIITDKNTGRSKGYGFVTFRDPDAAMRACEDPAPVIDGRRANCNLASCRSTQRARPPTPPMQHFAMAQFQLPQIGSDVAASSSYYGSAATATNTSYFHHPSQYANAHFNYGYTGAYSQENMYPMNYYSSYSGGAQQQQMFTPYYTAGTGANYHNFTPYYTQYTQNNQSQTLYGIHYPQMLQYSYLPQHQYGYGFSANSVSATNTEAPSSSQIPPGNNIHDQNPSTS
ncbi:RNA-binding protein 38-like isoform X3 [Ananas comosus]|uniref:RNA-binding protein 38-like isoform X3 n=1 Tax=Ananas comosus TaxID=4615 RepID=A0A6P5ENS4_ANACO|nr:RNA-binding protein 38-like isoform X3 [Ananas comosus]